MLEKISAALCRRPLLGVGLSVVVHAALLMALLWVHPARIPTQKRGDALIVELPNLQESATRGTPGPEADALPVPAAPAPRPSPPRATPPTRPTPPTPPPAVAARPAPKAEARPAPRAVARAQEPAPSEHGEIAAPKPTPSAPETTKSAPEPVKPQTATPPSVASPPSSVDKQLAMVPPAPPDIRSALRRGGGGTSAGGAGGIGMGRGGILGETILLDSKDPDFSDYLERVRQLIKQNWGFPCIKNADTRVCEYKGARLVVDFGILRQGPVQFVEVRQSSGWPIYDDYAVNAIKFASPFPPVPPALMAKMERGSTGMPIRVNFVYILETGLTNILR
jgi:TonB family protein